MKIGRASSALRDLNSFQRRPAHAVAGRVGHHCCVVSQVVGLGASGLGLEHEAIRLVRAPAEWCDLGSALAEEVATLLGQRSCAVEHVGSTSVPGLLAKPILDLAVATATEPEPAPLQEALEPAGWAYLGDAGGAGGLVFMLEGTIGRRVAHLHAVRFDGRQWRAYLAFRALLRSDAAARHRYEATKVRLATAHPADRRAYTAGKDQIVEALLASTTGGTGCD